MSRTESPSLRLMTRAQIVAVWTIGSLCGRNAERRDVRRVSRRTVHVAGTAHVAAKGPTQ